MILVYIVHNTCSRYHVSYLFSEWDRILNITWFIAFWNHKSQYSTQIMSAILEWIGAILDVLYLFTKRLSLVWISVNDEWLGNTTKCQL